jgi:hypothetical protein
MLWLASSFFAREQGDLVVTYGPVIDLPDPHWREPIILNRGQGKLRTTLIKRLSPPEPVIRAVFQEAAGEILLVGRRSAFGFNISSNVFKRLPIPSEAKPIDADPSGGLFFIQDEKHLVKVDGNLQKIWDLKIDKYCEVAPLSRNRTLIWPTYDGTMTIMDRAGRETGRISHIHGSLDNGIVEDKSGAIWVTDCSMHLVSKLYEDGGRSSVLTEGLEINTDPNELFAYPFHLMVDAENRLWVENYLESEGDSVTIINPTRDRFLRFSSKEFLPELDHENEEYIVHVSPFDNTLLVTNVREPEMYHYSYELEFEEPSSHLSEESGFAHPNEQPMPTPNSAGVPQHVVGYWFPTKVPIVPLLGLILGAVAFVVLRRRRRRVD